MKKTGFIARPARSAIAEADLEVRKIWTSVRSSILAGLPPKRQPLAGMAIADSLHGAHHCEHDCPNRHVREVSPARRQRSADRRRIEPSKHPRARDPIDPHD